MAQPRVRGAAGSIYHCITRTVNGERLFDDVAKEGLRKQLHATAVFCGVEIITYVLMENHFHLLIKVTTAPEGGVNDTELMRRYRVLYPRPTPFAPAHADVLAATLAAGGAPAAALRARLQRLMHDLSAFMKLLKQRFSVWFNRTHTRYGTLWAERFTSTLVGAEYGALRTVAAYIDLNPVRAGICADPADYRFCGYGEALATGRLGPIHLEKTAESSAGAEADADVLASYRQSLFARAVVAKSDGAPAAILPAAAHDRETARRGRLPLPERLRHRVGWISRGVALGSEAFVLEQLAAYRARTGKRRHYAPRLLAALDPAADWPGLFALRGGA